MKTILHTILLFGLIAEVLAGHHHSGVNNWQRLNREDPETQIKVKIALKQRNLDKLEATFWSVSDPDSPSYGKYLTAEQIGDMIAPAQECIDQVKQWLNEYGVTEIDEVRTRDLLVAKMSVGLAEKIFAVPMYRHVNAKGRHMIRSTESYHLPSHVSQHIDLVLGISDLPPTPLKAANGGSATPIRSPNVDGVPSVNIVRVLARGGTKAEVSFIPICRNGMTSGTTNPPCMDHPPEVQGVTIQTSSWVNHDGTKGHSPQLNCHVNDQGTAQCNAFFELPLYVEQQVNVSIFYDGQDSPQPFASWPFPVVATAPILPQSIAQLYGIPRNTYVLNPNATQCVGEFEQQYYSPSDLEMFFEYTGIYNGAPVTVIGPNNITNPGGEANLDIQYIMGMAPGSPTVFWSIAANSTEEIDDILTWSFAIGNMTNPPLVSSLSYGMSENNVDTYLGLGYLARSDVEFQKLANLGLTVIIADGDTGAGDLGALPMSNPTCEVLHPDWPSQSPYVTAVGSTFVTPFAEPICYLPESQGGINCRENPLGEITVSMDNGLFWTSGGGFSNVQPRPGYQNSFVQSYLSKNDSLPPAYAFNSSGRGYPDFVAVGHNLMVALSGTFIPVDGTSASAPIFAGIITLLNDARISAGKSPLGFLNPAMYKIAASTPSAFYDVTVGYNRCGSIDWQPACCPFGYHATQGWDAASGLGSPNFAVLKQAVLALN
eukprot:TRINITY_DN14857_c0_g1_i1.p1 TRINITY_DN14857_c0_g1~~TRINITY_DN14857_c0_g1_i1.p1  ORF type:complete len:713 (-),score=198.18 TRINITY_DN14857_c0_g1_i1:20-2158(-)